MTYFRRDVITAVIAQIFTGYSLSTFMGYVGIHLTDLQATATIIALVFTSRNFFQIFLRVPFSEMSQIIGRKPLIVMGLISYTIAFILLFFSTSWIHVLIATFMIGLGMSLYYPAMFAYIGDISTNDYGKINGYIFQGSDIGIILGSIVARYLLQNGIVNLVGLFLVTSIVGTAGVILTSLLIREVLLEKDRIHVESIPKALFNAFIRSMHNVIYLTKKPKLRIVYTFQLFIAFTEFFIGSFFPLLIVLHFGFPESEVAFIALISTLILLFFKPYLGKISDRFGFKWPIIVSLMSISILLLVINKLSNLYIIIIFYSLILGLIATSYLASNGGTSYAAIPAERGLAMGTLGFYVSFGRSASSLASGPILDYFEKRSNNLGNSIVSLFNVMAILILLGSIFLIVISRNIRIRSEEKIPDVQDKFYPETYTAD